MIEACRELPAGRAPYESRFPGVAALAASVIKDRMPEATVEHIGNTAVPGCGGKGVVDLLVVCAPSVLESAKACLAVTGFQPQRTRVPFPESRPMRVGALRYQGEVFRMHVHALTAGMPEAGELGLAE